MWKSQAVFFIGHHYQEGIMLDNDTYIVLQRVKQEMADRERSFIYYRNEPVKRGRIVHFILHETGKALVSTGNRLLAIA